MIADTITGQIGEALKAHNEVRLSTLRMLSSALNYEKIAKMHVLSADEEIVVVRREIKKRKDAIAIYEEHKSDKTDALKNKEIEELKILQEYLPEEMGDEELTAIVNGAIQETNAQGIKDMGKVIGLVKSKAGSRAEGSKIAEIVKSKLSQ